MRFLIILLLPIQLFAQHLKQDELIRCSDQAKNVTIIRDHFGVPHIYGKTDANAVFGLLYAQCEDDFPRVEMNYIEKLGRLSEVTGKASLYSDLQIRMLIDSSEAINEYKTSPQWLRKLLDSYADAINFYLYNHHEVHPALLNHFEPWYPLLWTDGSIGAISVGDLTIRQLQAFYSPDKSLAISNKIEEYKEEDATGSNSFALSPSKTASGNSILYINPHVTFYFRPEVHVNSEEGLHAYGAVTWGQIFVYQGFNEHCGWMHTSSRADVSDVYQEKIQKKNGKLFYEYDGKLRSITEKNIQIKYVEAGIIKTQSFKTYYTHHGPVMGESNGKWLSVRSYNRALKSFEQSWLRTKAGGLEDFKKTMEYYANTSNNTVFADDKGNIAYWHGNYMPKRDPAYNWNNPVDGSITATEWKGLHTLDETIHIYNPKSGFIQNCNSTPFTVSGVSSPLKKDYPAYMAPDGENFRAINAVKILSANSGYTLDKITKDGYNSHLAVFDVLIPALIKASKSPTAKNASVDSAITILSSWDRNSSQHSIATSLAIFWAEKMQPKIMKTNDEDENADQVEKTTRFAKNISDTFLINSLSRAMNTLKTKYGTWQTEWGDINRFQRITNDLNEFHDDNKTSIPDGFAPSTWGCIPSFVSKEYPNCSKRYGYNGNSFICAVEFGKKIKARSLLAGGESGDINSIHFKDQAERYTQGIFKDVNFYKEDVEKNAERTYHPGINNTLDY